MRDFEDARRFRWSPAAKPFPKGERLRRIRAVIDSWNDDMTVREVRFEPAAFDARARAPSASLPSPPCPRQRSPASNLSHRQYPALLQQCNMCQDALLLQRCTAGGQPDRVEAQGPQVRRPSRPHHQLAEAPTGCLRQSTAVGALQREARQDSWRRLSHARRRSPGDWRKVR